MAAASTSRYPQAVTNHVWHLFDARNQIVGRLAQEVSKLLIGKHKPSYTPHIDEGDTVVIINSELVKFTGSKWDKKLYRYHTGFPGGLKSITAKDMLLKHPTFILKKAIAGMIKKNKFKVDRVRRLKLYIGSEHPHQAVFPPEIMKKYNEHQNTIQQNQLNYELNQTNPIIKAQINAARKAEMEVKLKEMEIQSQKEASNRPKSAPSTAGNTAGTAAAKPAPAAPAAAPKAAPKK